MPTNYITRGKVPRERKGSVGISKRRQSDITTGFDLKSRRFPGNLELTWQLGRVAYVRQGDCSVISLRSDTTLPGMQPVGCNRRQSSVLLFSR
jgi:hypothetical protein